MNKFSINIGPGTTIGSMAIGEGATAEGSVDSEVKSDHIIHCMIDINNASPQLVADLLRCLATKIENRNGAALEYYQSMPGGMSVLWTVK